MNPKNLAMRTSISVLFLVLFAYIQAKTINIKGKNSDRTEVISFNSFPLTATCDTKDDSPVMWMQSLDVQIRDEYDIITDFKGKYHKNILMAESNGKQLVIQKVDNDFLPLSLHCFSKNNPNVLITYIYHKIDIKCPVKALNLDNGDKRNISCSVRGEADLSYKVGDLSESNKDYKSDYVKDSVDVGSVITIDMIASKQFNGIVAQCLETDEVICETKINVKYGAITPVMLPREEDVKIGQEVECEADGNPTPEVQFFVNDKRVGKSGQKAKYVVAEPINNKKRKLSLKCVATNTFKGKTSTSEFVMKYNVIGKISKRTDKGKIMKKADKEAETKTKNASGAASIVIGVIITLIVMLLISVVVYFVIRNQKSQKIPKDAKRVPTENEEYSSELRGGLTGKNNHQKNSIINQHNTSMAYESRV